MADIQSVIPRDIDFNNKRYVLVNAKQYDKQSRYILFSCYDNNKFVHIDRTANTAIVRYRKADGYGVLNECTITEDGCVLTELTEQMLAANGLCCADLIIVKGRSVKFDENGNILRETAPNILSTMTFYVDVAEMPFDTSSIESSYDYSLFNKTLGDLENDYSDVIKMAKSYAVGGTGKRVGENYDNAKYYYEQAREVAIGNSVTGIKGAAEEMGANEYHTGNIIIDAEDVGAIPVDNIASVDQVKAALEIN